MRDKFLKYLASVRRYSPRTVEIYADVLAEYNDFSDNAPVSVQAVRAYEVYLMEQKKACPKTVNLHLSVLSSYCRFLVREGVLTSNPVRLVARPRVERRLPEFFREESVRQYFESTKGALEYGSYESALSRIVISILYSTGIRRSELISLDRGSIDWNRRELRVHGKGDVVREIPLTDTLCEEICLYLQKIDSLKECVSGPDAPLLQTERGGRLYPMLVERIVRRELGGVDAITSRKSPHVLRHTLATELLDKGADLNSIKEMLGHSSLAATQVYTHNSIERLKNVYNNAHPRAKKGGNHGDQD